jgi:hypothetical protein
MPSLRELTAKADERNAPDFFCATCARRYAKGFLGQPSKGKQRAVCKFCLLRRHDQDKR